MNFELLQILEKISIIGVADNWIRSLDILWVINNV